MTRTCRPCCFATRPATGLALPTNPLTSIPSCGWRLGHGQTTGRLSTRRLRPTRQTSSPACSRKRDAGSTYWPRSGRSGKKATILHMWHHAPADKKFRDRQSRHYYDLVRSVSARIGKGRNQGRRAAVEGRATRRYSSRRPGHGTQMPSQVRSASCLRMHACRNWSRTIARCGR